MQSSSKIIKNSQIKENGKIEIKTEYEIPMQEYENEANKENDESLDNNTWQNEKACEDIIKRCEKIGSKILENARKESSLIKEKALKESIEIKENAIKNGHEEGYENGYKKGEKEGYSSGYNDAIKEAKEEADDIRKEAKDVLLSAKNEYINYLKEKKEEIQELISYVFKETLKKECENEKFLNNLLYEILEQCKEAKTLIIKFNSFYEEEIRTKMDNWKQSLAIKAEILILVDDSIEKGKAIIEKEDGKIEIDIDDIINKVDSIIKNS